jgi:membrane protein
MKKFSFGLVWKSLKDSFKAFGQDKVPKLSASLAYYTGFSLAPLLVLVIAIGGLVLGQEAVQGTIQEQIAGIVGPDAGKQIQDMIKNATLTGKSTFATVVSGTVLLISATTIFGEIQDSINSIWGLKPKPSAGIMSLLMTRLISFGMIASLGFILMVSLVATSVLEGLGSRLQGVFPGVSVVLFYILNLVFTLFVITVLFAVIFKVLPDVKLKWRAVLPGAIATAILFMIGKFGISLYISKSDLGSSYGAASSLAVIFVWIYYSAIILYFGAEFTKAYALNKGEKIIPDKYVVWDEKPTVPGAEPKKTPASPSPSERESRPKQQPAPQIALASQERMAYLDRPQENNQKKKPGMGTVLFGLALYFATRGKEGKRAPE